MIKSEMSARHSQKKKLSKKVENSPKLPKFSVDFNLNSSQGKNKLEIEPNTLAKNILNQDTDSYSITSLSNFDNKRLTSNGDFSVEDHKNMNGIRRSCLLVGDELEEMNYGFEFAKLKQDDNMKKRLSQFLLKHKKEMEKNVIDGTQPVFGYPLMCYSIREQAS